MNDGGPAFPIEHVVVDANNPFFKPGSKGMSLRDWFAGMAMQGMMSMTPGIGSQIADEVHRDADKAASWAYQIADSMLLFKRNEHLPYS